MFIFGYDLLWFIYLRKRGETILTHIKLNVMFCNKNVINYLRLFNDYNREKQWYPSHFDLMITEK